MLTLTLELSSGYSVRARWTCLNLPYLARIFHELLAATTNMAALPGVLGCRHLRRTVQVRLGTNPAVPRDELPGGTPICVVSRQQFMKYPGYRLLREQSV